MSNEIQFILYNLPDNDGKVQVVIKDETIWCTQKAMAELFGIDKSGISRHIANILKEEELQRDTTVAKIATVVNRGIRGEVEELVDFYNLDMIIAVGYRVSSPKATKFRQWATKILNEYIKKGFVLDDERLKQGTAVFGKDYFRELLERVRSIRASERRIWQQITDIYAECSIDYDKNSPTTHDFYALIQNRFHYAITGQTAAEIIYTKADHTQEHMGLTSWKNAPDGRNLKSDVSIGISRHIANIFKEEELQQDTTVAKIATVVNRGIRGEVEELVDFYNLDMIIAVGYRVSSPKATKFRQWATKILNEYIKKGFVLDDERLKQGTAVFGKDYFRELLERVRSIRTSERRIWQQITDIYAECSIDYDKNSPTTHDFYAMIQNRFHYAITGQTAAEIIYTKADHTQEHMGLTTWKNAPDGRILKSDVSIAKNYLQENEIRRLERAVTGYFDYIEDLIERENTFNMEQFAASVNEFLTFRRYQILPDKGRISAAQAKIKAESEYDIFNKTQRIDSDFDKEVRGMLGEK